MKKIFNYINYYYINLISNLFLTAIFEKQLLFINYFFFRMWIFQCGSAGFNESLTAFLYFVYKLKHVDTSCIGRKRQKGNGDDSAMWTIRRRRLTGPAMFTIAHVLGVLHIEDYNELSFLMLAICPTLLLLSLSLFPLSASSSSPYTCLLYVQGFPLIFFDSSSRVRLPADQTRRLGSSLFIFPPALPSRGSPPLLWS